MIVSSLKPRLYYDIILHKGYRYTSIFVAPLCSGSNFVTFCFLPYKTGLVAVVRCCLVDFISGHPTYLGNTVELQWLEHLWDYENKFETGIVRANDCQS